MFLTEEGSSRSHLLVPGQGAGYRGEAHRQAKGSGNDHPDF